jgi:hypothetical protein
MKTVKCQNVVAGQKCGRILGILTDLQVEILQVDPEKGSILRCPKCHPEQRWSQISVTKDGKNSIETLSNHDTQGKFPEELQFDEKIICEQVG